MSLSQQQCDDLAEYVAELQEQMNLSHWQIRVIGEAPDDKGAMATITPVYGQQFANMHFAYDFPELEPEKMRMYVTHELIHIPLHQIYRAACHAEESLGGNAWAVLDESLREAIEYATDHLARAWAPMLPLPSFRWEPPKRPEEDKDREA